MRRFAFEETLGVFNRELILLAKKYEFLPEMGPFGLVGTGQSHMAQDHFQTIPGPKRGYIKPKRSQKSLKVRAKPAKAIDCMAESHTHLKSMKHANSVDL